MLTGKQKRFLRAMGSTMDPIVQIGKAGAAQAVIESAQDAIRANELIKVRVLQNSPQEPKEAITGLAQATDAELVQVIGRNGLLYKKNDEKPIIELP